MYVEFPGGAWEPAGYIVPCEVVKTIPGWTYVVLRPAPPNDGNSWRQWVRNAQLIIDSDVAEL